jgi:TM2 domain-containing membrane protein YozV
MPSATVTCGQCRQFLVLDETLSGSIYPCPRCGNEVQVPGVEKRSIPTVNRTKPTPPEHECNRIVAFLLAFFLGAFGAHKFYLGRTSIGLFYLMLTFFGPLLLFIPNLMVVTISFLESLFYLSCPNDKELTRRYGPSGTAHQI